MYDYSFNKTGAAQPEYTITADDCDSMVAIECVPMDERGRRVSTDVKYSICTLMNVLNLLGGNYLDVQALISCGLWFVIRRVTLSQSWQMMVTGSHKVGGLYYTTSWPYS